MRNHHDLAVLDALEDGWDVLRLGAGYEGGCPCSSFAIDKTKIDLHCWRVDGTHAGCGLHFRGNKVIALRLKPLLDAIDWYGEWTIVEGVWYGAT